MKITILTLFPEMYENFLNTSIVGRSIQRGIIEVECINIRDFSEDKFKRVDDTSFGGGAGMVMKCQPVLDALDSVKKDSSHTIMMNPCGRPYTQQKAHELSSYEHLIILCGHYEGMDARINDHCDELISIGDYVLTGGELASMIIVDSVTRLLKGAIKQESYEEESYEQGLLEYPQYTKPADYKGEKVPEVLLSGNHSKIKEYRTLQSLLLTRKNRPDLFEKYVLSKEERKILEKYDEENTND